MKRAACMFLFCVMCLPLARAEESAKTHLEKGLKLFSNSKLVEAAVEFEKTLAADPGNAKARMFLGHTFYYRRKYPEAVEHYRKCLDLLNQGAELEDIHRNVMISALGMAQGLLGDFDGAMKTLRMGMSLAPSFTLFYYNEARLYARAGRPAEALSSLADTFVAAPSPWLLTRLLISANRDGYFRSLKSDPAFLELLAVFSRAFPARSLHPASSPDDVLEVTVPARPLKLVIKVPNYEPWDAYPSANFARVILAARDVPDGYFVVIWTGMVAEGSSPAQCRDMLAKTLRPIAHSLKTEDRGDYALSIYSTDEPEGIQKNYNGYFVKGRLYFDVHVWKVGFEESDDPKMRAIIDSVRITELPRE